MTEGDVIERLCKLAGEVGERVFEHEVASDCFCGRGGLPVDWQFRFDPAVLNYIDRAVRVAIRRDEKLMHTRRPTHKPHIDYRRWMATR